MTLLTIIISVMLHVISIIFHYRGRWPRGPAATLYRDCAQVIFSLNKQVAKQITFWFQIVFYSHLLRQFHHDLHEKQMIGKNAVKFAYQESDA